MADSRLLPLCGGYGSQLALASGYTACKCSRADVNDTQGWLLHRSCTGNMNRQPCLLVPESSSIITVLDDCQTSLEASPGEGLEYFDEDTRISEMLSSSELQGYAAAASRGRSWCLQRLNAAFYTRCLPERHCSPSHALSWFCCRNAHFICVQRLGEDRGPLVGAIEACPSVPFPALPA